MKIVMLALLTLMGNFASGSSYSSSHASSDALALKSALDEANSALQSAQGRSSCPGTDLVVSCGNGVCEPKLGENETTCPSDCVPALIKSYNSQTLCRGISHIFQPATVEEVQQIVRGAAAANQHIRVVGKLHSANEQLCTTGVVISTEKLDHVLGLESFDGRETVVTEPGITLYDLGEWLHAKNRSLGYAVIGYHGVSVAGAAATGSHGSTMKHSDVVSSSVESAWIVGADGELREYSALKSDLTTWKAVRTNLGMLGVVVRIRMRIQPQFNLHVKATFDSDAKLFARGGVMGLMKKCDYGLINWFPGTGRIMRSCGMETTKAAEPGAANMLLDPGFPEYIVKPFKKVLQYGACYNWVGCLVERVRYLYFKAVPPFEKMDEFGDLVPTDETIGPSHRMMSSVLTEYQKGFFQMDWELAVPYQKAQAALEAVRDLAKKNHLCLPLVGIFLRFAPAEDATLLAHTVALGEFHKGEPAMFIEMPVYLPTAFSPEQKAKYDHPYEEFARMLIEKFSARPHWGKNRDWLFKFAQDHDSYGVNLAEFRQTVKKLDPTGMFMNDWGKYVGFATPATDRQK